VRDGEQPVRHPEPPRQHGRLAMQPERRRRAALADDLDVAPSDAAAPPGAEHLHRRFLGGEPRRIALEAAAPARLAVGLLALGENARPEARAVLRAQGALDAADLAEIDPDARDRPAVPCRWLLRRSSLRVRPGARRH
jgi:hypothetical protein